MKCGGGGGVTLKNIFFNLSTFYTDSLFRVLDSRQIYFGKTRVERMTVNRLFNTLCTRSEAYQRYNQSISNQAMNERVTSQSDSSRGSQISHPPQQPRRGDSVSSDPPAATRKYSSDDGGEERRRLIGAIVAPAARVTPAWR